jgi:hypothetical protein
MNTQTDIIISALRILVNDIQSPDGVPNACVAQAADRLEELQQKCNMHYETICDLTKQRNQAREKLEVALYQLKEARSSANQRKVDAETFVEQRNEARADVERLCALNGRLQEENREVNAANAPHIRPEPSRLEIAARLMAANLSRETEQWETVEEVVWAVEQADALIAAAAKEGK